MSFPTIEVIEPPKYENHPDVGCMHSPSCLDCPLPICVHDEGGQVARMKFERQQTLETIARDGLTVEQAAERLGVTVRTVYRWLQKERDCQSAA